ncbi:hypothetical protein V5O48_009602 [Marasmius crinis-equi]|uniref:Uncharacterized protein n=1 Tax=Marasmius crinis-equi TaxID=585013 RepID=A0ABR3FBA5_9AGAR
MPRKRLYHTHEEQRLANNAKAKRWRDKNSEFIKRQRRDKRQAEEERRVQELQRKKERWSVRRKREDRIQAAHSRTTQAEARREQEKDTDIVKPLLAKARDYYANFRREVPNSIDYLEDLYQEIITPVRGGYRHYSYLAEPANKLENIDDSLSKVHMAILNLVGPSTEWKRVKSMREDIRQVIKWIEDLQRVAKDGTLALEEAYDERELRFRQHKQR